MTTSTLLQRASQELDALQQNTLPSSCSFTREVGSVIAQTTSTPPSTTTNTRPATPKTTGVPPTCLHLILALPGNGRCVDCGAKRPTWASISYGCLLCLQCSGRHRSYGVQTSVVRSLHLDDWTRVQVLALLEGGNHQLEQFFRRHAMSSTSSSSPPSLATKKPLITTAATSAPGTAAVAAAASGDSTATITAYPHSSSSIRKNHMCYRRYLTKAALFYRTHLTLHVQGVLSMGCPYAGRDSYRQKTIVAQPQQQQRQRQEQQEQHLLLQPCQPNCRPEGGNNHMDTISSAEVSSSTTTTSSPRQTVTVRL